MHDAKELKVPKWPFFLADAFMLGMAWFIFSEGKGPLSHWEIGAIGICVGLGALSGVIPFLLEYRALLKLIETDAVGNAVEKIQNLEALALQISGATNHWQSAQDQADKTAALAREISERMAREVREFTEFMQKINEGEKATLRLETDKLRRAEQDWLTVVVHMLDHVYALHHAAERSGQTALIAQLGQFQNACREAARRVGLLPFAAAPAEAFDPKRHQWADGEGPPPGGTVTETMACGYTFQGRPLRPALVRVQPSSPTQTAISESEARPQPAKIEAAPSESDAGPQTAQSQLPLEPEAAAPVQEP